MNKKVYGLILTVLVLSLVLASCAPKAVETIVPPPTEPPVVNTKAPEATPTTAYPPAPEFIEIGASIPLTGKFGSLGSQVKVGYDYAIADINAAGGVFVSEYNTKIPLRLTSYD